MRDTIVATEKYGNEAPPEVAHLTPAQAYAYGWNACLNATMRGMPPVFPNPEAAPDVAVED